jgi:hypothetical protein
VLSGIRFGCVGCLSWGLYGGPYQVVVCSMILFLGRVIRELLQRCDQRLGETRRLPCVRSCAWAKGGRREQTVATGALQEGDATGTCRNPRTGGPSAGSRSPAGWLCEPPLGARRPGGAAFPAGERQAAAWHPRQARDMATTCSAIVEGVAVRSPLRRRPLSGDGSSHRTDDTDMAHPNAAKPQWPRST